MLYYFGMYPKNGKPFSLNYYLIYTFIVCAAYILHIVNRCKYFLSTLDNLMECLATIGMLLTEIMTGVKILIYVLKWKTFEKLIESTEKNIFQPQNKVQLDLVNNFCKPWIFLMVVYVTVTPVLCFIMELVPPFMKTNSYEDNLPVKINALYDFNKPVLYEITLLHQYFAFNIVLILTAAVDGLIINLLVFIGIECELLTHNLKNLYVDVLKDIGKKRPNINDMSVVGERMCIKLKKIYIIIKKFYSNSFRIFNTNLVII